MRRTDVHRRGIRRTSAGALALVAVLVVAAQAASGKPRQTFDGATIEQPAPVPPFVLHDQNGKRVSLEAERGKLVLLTFLYTHCKDVCPLTAQNLNLAVAQLGTDRKNVRVLAISVDPAGDTPASVKKFVRVHQLSSQFHYLTGTASQLAPVWRAYNVVSVRRAAGDIDHTLYTLLVDRTGKGRVLFDSTAKPAAIAHDLRLLLT